MTLTISQKKEFMLLGDFGKQEWNTSKERYYGKILLFF